MPNNSLPSVYCIIVTFNGIKWVENCLLSLRNSEVPLKIIIIDNGSKDGTREIIKNRFSEVNLIETSTNLGFGSANNVGVEIAIKEKADYVFLLNQDTIVYPETVTRLVKVFEIDDKLGIISPIHLNDSGDGLDHNFSMYVSKNKIVSDYLGERTLQKYYPISFVNAAAWLVKVNVIKKIGLFSKAFFQYGEDDNFLQRLTYHGYQCAIVPSSFIHHFRNERAGKDAKKKSAKRELVILLVYLLNINISYPSAKRFAYRRAIKHLIRGRLNLFIQYIYICVLKSPAMKKIRKAYIECPPDPLRSI